MGPVAFCMGLLLLLAAPIMRGGNRYIALIPLEWIGLAVLLALWLHHARAGRLERATPNPLLMLLALSPLLLALLQLLPVPSDWWARLPGRAVYGEALQTLGASDRAWRPVSVNPAATAASLLAGIPLAAALLMGVLASYSQLRAIAKVVVAMAMAQVVLGLIQLAGGEGLLMLGSSSSTPVGTFNNRNHFANYIAMAMFAYLWLASEASSSRGRAGAPNDRHRSLLLAAGGLSLLLGLLMSRSRGAQLSALPLALVGLWLAWPRATHAAPTWRALLAVALGLLFVAAGAIGFDTVAVRFAPDDVVAAAGYRGKLALTSLDAALAFWPWGSGWGTYDQIYPRFQPADIVGMAHHAHMDYVEMLLEGGVFFIFLAVAFAWLAVRRALFLAAVAKRHRTLDRESMACALCGLGLLALLLHSLVEFNMRIPANAILGALLAGAYLRPLSAARANA
ncbi:MAG TPA: O-antigen ligase family protein [Ramlibacter sp.]|nr:O-antigen ligase family protein [Ramlibacter sp.]